VSPPSIRRSVPASSPGEPEPPEPTVRSVAAERPPVRWVRGVALMVLALCVAYVGVEVWGAGRFRLDHGQDDQHPLGYALIALGMVMVLVLPIVLVVLAFRRRRPPRREESVWSLDD
jgi:hypothetical protein